MRAFLAGVLLMVAISAGAAFLLQTLPYSSADVYQSKSSVRLDGNG